VGHSINLVLQSSRKSPPSEKSFVPKDITRTTLVTFFIVPLHLGVVWRPLDLM
jgi:hypothetical protein